MKSEMKHECGYPLLENKGECPICGRLMYDDGKSINRHHFVPKSRGGREQEWVHTICHNQIHGIWTEKELAEEYSDPEKIASHPEMVKFIAWIRKKDPLFYAKTKDFCERKRKRRGR